MRILFSTEGTYPYATGGVSTWASALLTGLPQHDFTVVAVIANPHVSCRYPIPGNVRVLPVPLWGAERVEEYLPRRGRPFATARTTRRVVTREFLPVLRDLVDALTLADGDPRTLGRCVTALAEFSAGHDLRTALRDERAWSIVAERLASHPLYRRLSVTDAVDLARSLYRYLMPLALPVPRVDVAHSSAAAFCALPALVAKLRDGVPLIVSEHGIYLRERILDLVRDETPTLRKVLFGNLYRGVAQTVYQHADLVVPVCSYNTSWETRLGVGVPRLRVIHNGVDPHRFPAAPSVTRRPTVAFVGRIDPLKDVLNLVAAAARVRRAVPAAVFLLHGADSDERYGQRCRRAVAAEGLGDAVRFLGPTDDVATAYREADVVVLPSLSEGFPFTLYWRSPQSRRAPRSQQVTVRTDGRRRLTVWFGRRVVFRSGRLHMRMEAPFQPYLEVQALRTGYVSRFTDFWVTRNSAITVSGLPPGARVRLRRAPAAGGRPRLLAAAAASRAGVATLRLPPPAAKGRATLTVTSTAHTLRFGPFGYAGGDRYRLRRRR